MTWSLGKKIKVDSLPKNTTDKAQGVSAWLYGAEHWAPEDHMFKSGSDCLEAFPEAGPACGVVSTTTYQAAIERAEDAERNAEAWRATSHANLYELTAEKMRSGKLVEACKLFTHSDGGWPGDDEVVNLVIAVQAYEKGE